MIFKALPCHTRWEALLVVFWLALIQGLVLIWMARRPVDLIKFLLIVLLVASVPLLFYLLQRVWAAFSIEYWIDRNALTLVWTGRREIVPLPAIRRIVRGGVAALDDPPWMQWPAPYVGAGRLDPETDAFADPMEETAQPDANGIEARLVASRPPQECLLIQTKDRIYAISPADPDGFLAALQERYRLGPVRLPTDEDARQGARAGGAATGILLLGGGLVGAMILFGLLMIRYPDLPDALAFQYNSDGIPIVVREKTALFLLPIIGLLAWVINGAWGAWMAYRRQLIGAYMLWGGAIVVQLCSMMALISIIN